MINKDIITIVKDLQEEFDLMVCSCDMYKKLCPKCSWKDRVSQISQALLDLHEENGLLDKRWNETVLFHKADLDGHYEDMKKLEAKLKIAVEALEEPCPACVKMTEDAISRGEWIASECCSKCKKCSEVLSQIT